MQDKWESAPSDGAQETLQAPVMVSVAVGEHDGLDVRE